MPQLPAMPAGPDWKRALTVGMQVTEMRRSQARAVAADLVAQGHLARDQMSAAVDELLDLSRRRTDELRRMVQKEVKRQLNMVGIATKADLAALERRLTKAARASKAPAKKKPTGKAPTKKRAKKAGKKAV